MSHRSELCCYAHAVLKDTQVGGGCSRLGSSSLRQNVAITFKVMDSRASILLAASTFRPI